MAKSEKADVWMPLYIGDYLADTTRLTTEQHGAYLLLIMDYWRNGPPPDEKIVLQTITRLTDFLWKKHGPVLRNFFEVRDGYWHHKRIDSEMAEARTGKASASEKARNAANARWGKNDAASMPQADAPSMLDECPSPSPSPSKPKTLGSNNDNSSSHARGEHAFLSSADVAKSVIAWERARNKAATGITASNQRVVELAAMQLTPDELRRAYNDAVTERDRSHDVRPVNAGFIRNFVEQNRRPQPPPTRTFHDDRADTIAGLTGTNRTHGADNDDRRTVDVPAKRIA